MSHEETDSQEARMQTTQASTMMAPAFSSDDARPTPCDDARTSLDQAEVFWIATVRPDGRPHVTPLLSVQHDAALYFCTGPGEQKAKNLARNPHCILMTGCNSRADGLDIVLEGDAMRVTDDQVLRQIAASYLSKYGNEWRFTVHDGGFTHAAESLRADTGIAVVYEVAPNTAFAFHKGRTYSQTRFRFSSE